MSTQLVRKPRLPRKPHLDSLKKQARQLLKGYKSDQPDAVERIQAALVELPPSAAESFTLRHAQQVLAREYGFSSWQKLADEVGQPAVEEQPQNSPVANYDRMARDLIAAPRTGREEAREVVARENDCQSWAQLAEAVSAHASPHFPLKDQLRGLERLHDEFARRLAVNFTFVEGVDRRVDVDPAFVDKGFYCEFVDRIGSPNRAFRLQVDGLDGDVVLDIAMPVVQGLVAAGGDQGNERARLEYFAERIARDLEKAWAPFHPIAVRSFELYTDPAALELAPAHEIVLELAFEAKARPAETGWCGRVSLCYPRPALVALMPQLAEYWPEESAAGG
ncbi:MAG: hypothetical protein IH961_10775 [Chloroflexi bacterium]|nr:hypothetical protein [Chloroflexota bacterium]